MLFNSLEFMVFLPLVFLVYWTLSRTKQNVFILAASYVFYGWWDWRFLGLIIFSSLVDFFVGKRLESNDDQLKRRYLLSISLITNLGLLGFFKYFNFFIDSFADLLHSVGLQANIPTLQIVLPVGISFYTFQTLSYTIDVYRRRMRPTDDLLQFMAFVSFFPQLVAGPIERAERLLGQFEVERKFDLVAAKDGSRQILWGFFKKVVIADGLAVHIEAAYSNPDASALQLALATIFFAVQIYCDFSGYSDIALGVARLFGFKLMRNFAYPYYATSIGDFWQRWHISLSTWFRDYLYIPLGGSRGGKLKRIRNIIITFTVSGFWHGANWTFVVWGFLHSLFYLPEVLLGDRVPKPESKLMRTLLLLVKGTVTFFAVCVAWVFFRSDSVSHAFTILERIGSLTTSTVPFVLPKEAIALTGTLLIWEWFFRDKQFALDVAAWPRPLRWLTYYGVILVIVFFGTFSNEPFIYFQF